MAPRLSKAERLRAERRGFQQFINAEQDRLDRGVYPEDEEGNVEKTITEYEEKVEEINDELGYEDRTQVLDDEREEVIAERVYSSDEEAQAEGLPSAEEGNEHWQEYYEELNSNANRGARVEAQVVEDLASEGITKQDIYNVVQKYDEFQEEMWGLFGVE